MTELCRKYLNWIQAKTYRDSVSLSSNSDSVALKKVTESPPWHHGLFRTLGRRLLRLLSPRSLPLIGVDDKDGFDDAFRGRGIARHRGISQKAAPVLLCCLAIWWGNHLGWQHCLYCTQQKTICNKKTKAEKKHGITLSSYLARKPCGVTTLQVYDFMICMLGWPNKQTKWQTKTSKKCGATRPPIWLKTICGDINIVHVNITYH